MQLKEKKTLLLYMIYTEADYQSPLLINNNKIEVGIP